MVPIYYYLMQRNRAPCKMYLISLFFAVAQYVYAFSSVPAHAYYDNHSNYASNLHIQDRTIQIASDHLRYNIAFYIKRAKNLLRFERRAQFTLALHIIIIIIIASIIRRFALVYLYAR